MGLMHVIGIGSYSSERIFTQSTSYFFDLALPFDIIFYSY